MSPAGERLGVRRMEAQRLARPTHEGPAELVRWMGALQAQDYGAAKWAVGLRLRGPATERTVDDALSKGEVLRVHALRGTWQLVSPEDIGWLVALVAPRLLQRERRRYAELGLQAADFRKALSAIARALSKGAHLTRGELAHALQRAGVSTAGQRLPYLLQRAELEGLICGGAARGKQLTFALVDERAPARRTLARDEALAELATRYFRSRGPATLSDFGWWSGLAAADAKSGLEAARPDLREERVGGVTFFSGQARPARATQAHLLPAFDELLVAYRDRDAVLDPAARDRINPRGGILSPCVVVGGRVVGLWSRALRAGRVEVAVDPFEPLSPPLWRKVEAAAERYGRYLGLEPKLERR